MKYMTEEEQEEFWERHTSSRKAIDGRMARLPFAKKLEILEKMRANHRAMRTAKKIEGGE